MAELHEILSVEGISEQAFRKIIQETITTFTKKADHFLGFDKKLKMYDESEAHLEPAGSDSKEIVTTVDEKLDHTDETVERYLDILFQKESTNQLASSDVVVDGVVILKNMPVTFLLGLENKLLLYRDVYNVAPTLAPGVSWEKDEINKEGVYVCRTPDIKQKTAKKFDFQILYEATDKHPAQIKEWEAQVPVGEFHTVHYSGMLSPRDKAEILKRIDKIYMAVKQARMRANTHKIENTDKKIGSKITDYIRYGL